jgi:hypothetical protein
MMEDFPLTAKAFPFEPQDLPEALQSPVKRVSVGFMLALTVANSVLYMCYISIGGLLLPLQNQHYRSSSQSCQPGHCGLYFCIAGPDRQSACGRVKRSHNVTLWAQTPVALRRSDCQSAGSGDYA